MTFDTVPVTVIVKETSVCVLVCSCRQLCPLGLSCTTGQEPLACSWSVSGIFLARAESNCLTDPRARVPQRLPAPGLISPLRPLLTLGQRFSKAHGTKCGYPKRGLTSSFPTQGALPRPAGHGCGETERDGQAEASDTTGVGAGSGPRTCAALSCRQGTRLAPPHADRVDNLALIGDSPGCHPRKNFPVGSLVLCGTSHHCTLQGSLEGALVHRFRANSRTTEALWTGRGFRAPGSDLRVGVGY